MTRSYRGEVTTAFEVLAEGLAPFVDGRMSSCYPDDDWILLAANKLGKRSDVIVSLSDPHFQLEVLNRWWGPVFASQLPESARQVVLDLRVARNHWAHPDEEHPFDLDYAARVHELAEELLAAVRSEQAERVSVLLADLRWQGIRQVARERGVSESEALLDQLVDLQTHYDSIQNQLADARATADSATGRAQAVSRRLAELQTQYITVSGLRESYLALQRQLEDERARQEAAEEDTSSLRNQLGSAEQALSGLHHEAQLLRDQLEQARAALEDVDPLDTEAGRRWAWLVAGLLVTLSVLVMMMATLGPQP